MPAVSVVGDKCSGHGGFPPRPSNSGAATVFVNGISCLKVGSGYDTHCNTTPTCHSGSLVNGSSTVFVEGVPIGRVGDPVDCGSVSAQGSSNVFAG